jgi:hypothetical protein
MPFMALSGVALTAFSVAATRARVDDSGGHCRATARACRLIDMWSRVPDAPERRARLAAPGRPRAGRSDVLVVGAGGALGSALLAEALAAGRFRRVRAVVAGPVVSALRSFEPLPEAALRAGRLHGAELAFVVFERARHSHGRDEAFVQPLPDELSALARRLHGGGARRLIVVVPHAPALLPQALKRGFASSAEAEVAALGFEHVVFVRAAQAPAGEAAGGALQRFADGWLQQLKWMVPAQEQPLRTPVLAARLVDLALWLPQAAPGTRVLTPERLPSSAAPGDEAGVCRSGTRGGDTPGAAASSAGDAGGAAAAAAGQTPR